MNNRFKFRVWNKARQCFVPEKEIFICGNGELVLIDEALSRTWVKDNPNYAVSLCTGLYDKNGKLIYEGDIVKTALSNEDISKQETVVFVVYWSNEEGVFNGKIIKQNNIKFFFIKEDYLYYLLGDEEDETEVIGNIYENADLLEEQQNDS